MDMVPNITTVETATAVLWGWLLTTGSAPNTAAAPHIALPVEVSKATSLSIFINLLTKIPNNSVPVTIIISINTAGNPTFTTS